MSKKGRSRQRKQKRDWVRRTMAPLPNEYVVDEVVRRFGLRNGFVRFDVRDGFVVAGEYGFRIENPETVYFWPEEDEPPVWEDLDELERRERLAQLRLSRRPFTGPVPKHLRSD